METFVGYIPLELLHIKLPLCVWLHDLDVVFKFLSLQQQTKLHVFTLNWSEHERAPH